jgi:hypothetical protein
LLDEITPRADLVVDYVDENELAGLNTSDEDDDMEDRLGDTEQPKPAGAVCFNARPACWYSPSPVLQLRVVLSCYPEDLGGIKTALFGGGEESATAQ